MKAEDVREEWVATLQKSLACVPGTLEDALRHALAAVAPEIAARERAECAGMVEAERALLSKYRDIFERMGNDDAVRARQPEIETLRRLAAAIRARGEG